EPPTAENPVSVVRPTETEPGIIAFHGSGADFDEFRLEMIGTGEGAQAYGYGLYFTDSEDIAKFYRDTVQFDQAMRGTAPIKYKGKVFEDLGDTAAAEAAPPSYNAIKSIAEEMNKLTGTFGKQTGPKTSPAEAAKDRVIRRLDAEIEKYSKAGQADADVGVIELPGGGTLEELLVTDLQQQKQAVLDINADDIEIATGKMYKVALSPKPDELLDYDLPFAEQSKDIQEKLLQAGYEVDPRTSGSGGMILEAIMGNVGREGAHLELGGKMGHARQVASQRLADAGIPGIKYFSGNSRTTAGGELIDVSQGNDGFRAKVAVENRSIGGKGRVITTSPPYKTEQEALDWAEEATKRAERNYVIFDDKAVKILEKYGIAGPVLVTGAAVGASKSGNDNEDSGSILPDAGVL
ncbi:MAG: hypothetical protein L7S70_01690, partial [Pseudomonadales bacterium]|nr:hypothetical protein [Pseudomonadales bacterium]